MYWTVWVLVHDSALHCNLDLNEEQSTELFNKIVETHCVNKWQTEIMDHEKHSNLRSYISYKTVYEMKPYLYLVKKPKYRIVI